MCATACRPMLASVVKKRPCAVTSVTSNPLRSQARRARSR
jgi:hypothetical protein